MVFFQDWLKVTINDYFSWDLYEKLPKSGNVDILGLTNQCRPKIYSAWHDQTTGVAFHTRKFIVKRAISENNLEDLKIALDGGFDVNEEIDPRYGYTPMTLAATMNRPAIMQYLYLRGANENQQDRSLNTPLMHAVKNWNFDCIKLLVEKYHCDLKIKDSQGQTAYDKASFKKLKAIATYLKSEEERQAKNQEIFNQVYNNESLKANNTKPLSKKQKEQEEHKRQELEKQIQFKQFPRFSIEFGFESLFKDQAGEALIKKKKIYASEGLKYPFNNFKGLYRLSFLSHKLVEDLTEDNIETFLKRS